MICTDCRQPVSSHEMFPEGRCPVVRVSWPAPGWPFSDELNGWLSGKSEATRPPRSTSQIRSTDEGGPRET